MWLVVKLVLKEISWTFAINFLNEVSDSIFSKFLDDITIYMWKKNSYFNWLYYKRYIFWKLGFWLILKLVLNKSFWHFFYNNFQWNFILWFFRSWRNYIRVLHIKISGLERLKYLRYLKIRSTIHAISKLRF